MGNNLFNNGHHTLNKPTHDIKMKLQKIILILVAFVGLLLFTHKVVLPLVMEVVKSDLFLTESDDLGALLQR